MLAQKLLSGGSEDQLYVDDVFSAYTYTGNGSTQTINNGIDLAGKGGMVWIKSRNATYSAPIVDTNRGATKVLVPSSTQAEYTQAQSISSFTTSGFSQGSSFNNNELNKTYVSWTFRKSPKFFDVVTYVGNGTTNKSFTHSLSCEVGTVIIKRTDTTGDWWVYHRSISSPSNNHLLLNSTAAAGAFTNWLTVTSTNITINVPSTGINANGGTYVAYLFAHDPSADGIIQCGSFTTDGSGNATVNLEWEPQYLMGKLSTGISDWYINDSMRGMPTDTNAKMLRANLSAIEGDSNIFYPTATGFKASGWGASATGIYLAIRRPNKPPTTGTQVYNAIARTGTGAAATVTGVGFAPDLVMASDRSGSQSHGCSYDRLRGAGRVLVASDTSAEYSDADTLVSFTNQGISVGASGNAWINGVYPYINHFFKRAPGVFDVVCYTGTGVAKTEAHNLGVAPELMIVKCRSTVGSWCVYAAPVGATHMGYIDSTAQFAASSAYWNDTVPTSSVFTVGTAPQVNQSAATYVAYLFATKLGISKVGSYTGNGGTADSVGSSQTINCGFTTGSRFVMLKCTSHTSDWVVIDTTRGLVAGNDPTLSLNTTAAEGTTQDLLDPDASGFVVNQLGSAAGTSANFNVTGRTYLVLSFS